jgi:hypothetical protein
MNSVLDHLIQGRSISDDVMMLAESVSVLKNQGYKEIPTSHFFNAYHLTAAGIGQVTAPVEIKQSIKDFLTGNSLATGRVVFVRNSPRLLEFNLKVVVDGQTIELCVSACLYFEDKDKFIKYYGSENSLSTTAFENKINDLIKSYATGSHCREDFISKVGFLERDFYGFLDGVNTGLFATVKVYVVAVSKKEKTELEQYQHERETEHQKRIIHFTLNQEFEELQRAADVGRKIRIIDGQAKIIPVLDKYKSTLHNYKLNEVDRDYELKRKQRELDHRLEWERLKREQEINEHGENTKRKNILEEADLLAQLRMKAAYPHPHALKAPEPKAPETYEKHFRCYCVSHMFQRNCGSSVDTFGEYFWGELIKSQPLLGKLLSDTSKPVERVCYADSYLTHPAHILAFGAAVEWLFKQSCIDKSTLLLVSLTFKPSEFYSPSLRTDILRSYLVTLTNGCYATVLSRKHLHHDRKLEIHFYDETSVTIDLSKGFGWWGLEDKSLEQEWLGLFSDQAEQKQKIKILEEEFNKAGAQQLVFQEVYGNAVIQATIPVLNKQ